MKHISVDVFKEILTKERDIPDVLFVNVCTPQEFQEKSIPGVHNIPLDVIGSRIDEFNDAKKIYLHCRSGNRSKKAAQILEDQGIGAEIYSVEGGLLAWEERSFDTVCQTSRLPIMRQVFIAAASLVLIGLIGSHLLHPWFEGLVWFLALGLLYSGVSGWCGMVYVLSKMPWNRNSNIKPTL